MIMKSKKTYKLIDTKPLTDIGNKKANHNRPLIKSIYILYHVMSCHVCVGQYTTF